MDTTTPDQQLTELRQHTKALTDALAQFRAGASAAITLLDAEDFTAAAEQIRAREDLKHQISHQIHGLTARLLKLSRIDDPRVQQAVRDSQDAVASATQDCAEAEKTLRIRVQKSRVESIRDLDEYQRGLRNYQPSVRSGQRVDRMT